MKFKRADGTFDVERFKAAVRIFITAQEIVVDNASYPTREIAENSHIFRTLGLGYANLGSLIMSYGLPYDSNEGRALAGAITAIMTGHAYEQSAAIAQILGPFKGYRDARCTHVTKPVAKNNVDSMLGVIRLHRAAVEESSPAANSIISRTKPAAPGTAPCTPASATAIATPRSPSSPPPAPSPSSWIAIPPASNPTSPSSNTSSSPAAACSRSSTAPCPKPSNASATPPPNPRPSSRISRSSTPSRTSSRMANPSQRPEARTSPGLRLRLPRLPRPAQHPLHGAPRHDGRRPAVHQRRHLQDRQSPQDCTVEDIRDAYVQAWRMGLKCVAIYRDGSKRSQPLNTRKTNEAGDKSANPRQPNSKPASRNSKPRSPGSNNKPATHPPPAPRNPQAITHKFDIAGHEGYLTVGLFDHGLPGELFITMAKEGSTIGGLMDGIGTLTSIALQYGVPLEALVKKFAYQRFEPSGFTKNPDIRSATSITDYVFRWLAVQFSPGYREANSPNRSQTELAIPGLLEEVKKKVNRPVPELPISDDDTTIVVAATPPLPDVAPTNGKGHTEPRAIQSLSDAISHFQLDAPLCPNCGHVTVRNGACHKCLNCGESLGVSPKRASIHQPSNASRSHDMRP
jgi:ribonucleoside-diphosphate reductase alpha chain